MEPQAEDVTDGADALKPIAKGMESRPIKCVLTEAEKIDRGAKLAVVDAEMRSTLEKKRAAMRGFNVVLKGLSEDQEKLDTAIRNGFEMREISCQWFEEQIKNEMFLLRSDTGEEVFRRPFDAHEIDRRERARQKALNFGGDTEGVSAASEGDSDDDDGFDDSEFGDDVDPDDDDGDEGADEAVAH